MRYRGSYSLISLLAAPLFVSSTFLDPSSLYTPGLVVGFMWNVLCTGVQPD